MLTKSCCYTFFINEKHNKEKATRGNKTRITSINYEEDYPVLNEEVKIRRVFQIMK